MQAFSAAQIVNFQFHQNLRRVSSHETQVGTEANHTKGTGIRTFSSLRSSNYCSLIHRKLPKSKLQALNSEEFGLVVEFEKDMGIQSELNSTEPFQEVVKSIEDKKLYKIIRLDNGLTALLISDPTIVDSSGNEKKDLDTELEEDGEESEEGSWEIDSADEVHGTEEEVKDPSRVVRVTSRSRLKRGKPPQAKQIEKSKLAEEEEDEEGDEDESEDEDYDDEEHDNEFSDEGEEDDDEDDTDSDDDHSEGLPATKKAAAAMCVGVGSFSDPKDAEGLAHFLEHMLFMGSAKYPDENEYDSFLSKHGGSSNAFTETEFTCFYFDVSAPFLKPALDRFAQFFISPLAKEDAMDREVQAVDSEFHQVLQSDTCRLQQIQCSTTIDPDHPFRKFSWGNRQSLSEPGVDMRHKLMSLYLDRYRAGAMNLVVSGGEPLEDLESWVREIFSSIRRGGRSAPSPAPAVVQPVWSPRQLYQIQSVKEQHVLELSWPLPCLDHVYETKPQDYVSHLIGHEADGSLLDLLKAKSLATGLTAGVGDSGYERNTNLFIFAVSIHLTDLGAQQVLEVIGLLFQYVAMLRARGPEPWVFQELQRISEMEFRFAEEEAADDYAVELACNMRVYPPSHTIYGDYVHSKWDPQLVSDTLALLTPYRMRVDFLTNSFDPSQPGVQVEPWFGTLYTTRDIPDEVLEEWASHTVRETSLTLPPRNEFIARDFSLRSAVAHKAPEAGHHHGHDGHAGSPGVPGVLGESPLMRIWYKLDDVFWTPRAETYVSVSSAHVSGTARDAALLELAGKLLEDSMNKTLYLANVAKLGSSIRANGHSLEIKFWGFSDRLAVLADRVLTGIKNFRVDQSRFNAVLEDLVRDHRNANIKPMKHSLYLRLRVLRLDAHDVQDRLSLLTTCRSEDLQTYLDAFKSQVFVEMLAHGNLDKGQTLELGNFVEASFAGPGTSAAAPSALRRERAVQLPGGANFVIADLAKKEDEGNSVVEMYFQGPLDLGQESMVDVCCVDLLEQMMYEPMFNQLRSQEQLGYRVDCGARLTFRVFGFCLRVQSAEYSPPHLMARIESFLATFRESLVSMADEEFETNREALIADKLEKDHNLGDESERYWEQITDKRYLFNTRKMEAALLQEKSIQKADVLNWFDKYVFEPSVDRRKLTVQIWGHGKRVPSDLRFVGSGISDGLPLENGLSGPISMGSHWVDEGQEWSKEEVKLVVDIDQFKASCNVLEASQVDIGTLHIH